MPFSILMWERFLGLRWLVAYSRAHWMLRLSEERTTGGVPSFQSSGYVDL
jgi:hypothetical protein